MQTNTIQVTAEPSSLVRAMGFAFANSLTVLRELAQNGNRAGATQVDIRFDPTTQTLVVEDDGCGITDWSKLLALAESGWDDAVKAEVSPYGLGFLSAVMACTTLVVESQGLRLEALTDDIKAIRPVPLTPIPHRAGTRIELRGFTPQVHCLASWMTDTFKGFAIEVSFNGQALARPNALGTFEGVATDIGRIRLAIPTGDVDARINSDWVAYLQGFPIVSNSRFHGDKSRCAIIHLDPKKFFGKLPDRDHLIDEEAARRLVTEAHTACVQRFLVEQKRDLPPDAFVRKWADACVDWKCAELLSDVPFLPGHWFSRYTAQPKQSRWAGDETGDEYLHNPGDGVLLTPEQLPDVIVNDQAIDLCDGEDGLDALYVWAKAMTLMDGGKADALHAAGHWIGERLVDVVDDVGVVATPVIRTHKPNTWIIDAIDTLALVESIKLTGPWGEVDLPANAAAMTEDALLVTKDTDSDVLLLFCDFICDDEYDEDMHDTACSRFHEAVAELAGASVPEVLTMLLNRATDYDIPKSAYGASLRLDIDTRGKITVSPL